jgi:hypothetical protein
MAGHVPAISFCVLATTNSVKTATGKSSGTVAGERTAFHGIHGTLRVAVRSSLLKDNNENRANRAVDGKRSAEAVRRH